MPPIRLASGAQPPAAAARHAAQGLAAAGQPVAGSLLAVKLPQERGPASGRRSVTGALIGAALIGNGARRCSTRRWRRHSSWQPCHSEPPLVLRRNFFEALVDEIPALLADPDAPKLKWTNDDCEADYNELERDQFYNHIQNHRVLTTKNGLMKTLATSPASQAFFPRCYDMNKREERDRFAVDFRRCSALKAARLHLRLRDSQGYAGCPDILRSVKEVLERWLEELDPPSPCCWTPPTTSAHGRATSAATLELRRALRRVREMRYERTDWDALLRYSELSPEELCAPETLSRSAPELEGHGRGALDPESCAGLERLVGRLEAASPQVALQGERNVWVIKPFDAGKGDGVLFKESLLDINRYCIYWQDHLVQKYIERPLLLSSGQKFDIRWWVLLTSVTPLKAYLFSHCYARVCNRAYDLGRLDDDQSHLSNYARNAKGCADAEDTVISMEGLKEQLALVTKDEGCWERRVLPQMQLIVRTTLKAAQRHLVPACGCFHVLGFDVMLDENLSLWLLEVNGKPGCEERAPFLSTMLRRMVRRTIEVVCLKLEDVGGDLDWIPLVDEREEE